MSPILKLTALDNVAIAISSVAANTQLVLTDDRLMTVDAIPAMHKVAVRQIEQGEEIIKYGQPIGTATATIRPGMHVHSHNCSSSTTEKHYNLCSKTKQSDLLDANRRASFMGYRRDIGKFGTRNYIGILATVNCSATVATAIAAQFSYEGALDDYPNVDGVVALTHESGCGMMGSGEAYELLRRTLTGYLSHPNFGGVLLIGLGCETMQIDQLIKGSGYTNHDNIKAFTIQDSGGTKSSIAKGIKELRSMLDRANQCVRVPIPVSEITLAVQCGGSDGFSGITANPALGVASDLLVQQGGTVIYSETPEIYGAEHLLVQRAESPQVGEQLLERIRWWEKYTAMHGIELNNNPSPGNKQGGLTTILEKSLGAQSKAGSSNLRAVYQYAEPIREQGLVFMDSPGFDPVSVTGQVASGANVICFTTGRGSAFGFKPVPSIKLASNNTVFERMKEDIDINCGPIISGELSVQACGEMIFQRILDVASGQKTVSEELGYGNQEFNPWKLGATV